LPVPARLAASGAATLRAARCDLSQPGLTVAARRVPGNVQSAAPGRVALRVQALREEAARSAAGSAMVACMPRQDQCRAPLSSVIEIVP